MILACVLTVVFELAVFLLAGYENRFIPLCATVNVMTNLTLNGFLRDYNLLLMEALVVAVEYIIYAMADGWSLKLFGVTLLANVVSFTAGILIFWL